MIRVSSDIESMFMVQVIYIINYLSDDCELDGDLADAALDWAFIREELA